MQNKSIRMWVYGIGIIPLIVLGCIYSSLPEMVPMHWNLDGTVDYGGKHSLWFLFAIGIILAVMFDVLPKIDPKNKNYEKFGKYYDHFALAMSIFIALLQGIVVIESFYPNTLNVGKTLIIVVGILFAFVGNMMPKMKMNFYMGIKTPWTLSNADVWNKTHRLGGRLMFAWGVIIMLSGLLMSLRFVMIVIIAGAVVIVGIPLVMSYRWYKLEENRKN